MSDLVQKFREWSDREDTHTNRLINIIDRHINNMRSFVSCLEEKDRNVFIKRMNSLKDEAGNLMEEYKEVFDDFAVDQEKMCEFLGEMKDALNE